MSGDHYGRYAQLSHEELYRMLMAGEPHQVENLASKWRSMQQTLDGLATSLNTSLDQLGKAWKSESGAEYQRRLSAISSYSSKLSAEFDQVHEGLGLMAAQLREARAKAENPADTDNADKAIRGATKGAAIGAVAGPAGVVFGGAIGAAFGHQQDEEEKAKAHQRMVRLVADLAAHYEMNRVNSWPAEPVAPPAGLPGSGSGGAATPARGPAVGAPGAAPHAGTGGDHTSRTVAGPGRVSALPADGAGIGGAKDSAGGTADPSSPTSGTALLGAGGALVGAGVLDAAALGAVLGASGPAGPHGDGGAGSMGTRAPVAGKVTGGAAGSPGTGLRGGVIGGQGEGRGPVDGKAASGTGRAAMTGEEADNDERMTWLTEDEMVWGGDEPSNPAVLGGESTPKS
jgi:uncharacterized protein YukE